MNSDACGSSYVPFAKGISVWSDRSDLSGRDDSAGRSASTFWETGMRKLKAIALRAHLSTEIAVCATRLHACLELLRQTHNGTWTHLPLATTR